jgi:hypothetical protein
MAISRFCKRYRAALSVGSYSRALIDPLQLELWSSWK